MYVQKLIIQNKIPADTKKIWLELWEKSSCAHFFNHPDWYEYNVSRNPANDFIVYIFKNNSKVIGLYPLVNEKKYGINCLSSPGGGFADKSSFLTLNPRILNFTEILKEIKGDHNLFLSEIPEDIFERTDVYNGNTHVFQSDVNYFLSLKEPLEYVSKKNKSKIRANIRKYHQNLSYYTYNGTDKILSIAVDIDHRSRKNQLNKSTFSNEETELKFRSLFKTFPKNFQVDILSFNGLPVIYSIGIVYKATYLAINTSYDAAFGFLSPGKLLTAFLIRRLKKDGYTLLDFGRGQSDLKREFTHSFQRQYNVIYSENSFINWYWERIKSTKDYILENESFYSVYRRYKKYLPL